jgi:hypothetical protein
VKRRLMLAMFIATGVMVLVVSVGAIAGVSWCQPIASALAQGVVVFYLLDRITAAASWIRRHLPRRPHQSGVRR